MRVVQGQLITVDVREEACQVSRELGADHSIDASQDNPVEVIQELTDGNGADVVFECAGGSPKQGLSGTKTLKQAIAAVRSGGKLNYRLMVRSSQWSLMLTRCGSGVSDAYSQTSAP